MEALSAALMIKALDGLTLRQMTTAQNIANAGTPNYRPVRVSFEAALKSAAAKGAEAVRTVEPRIEVQPTDPLGSQLRLDMEAATASSTAARYSGLIEILGRQLQLNALAVSGGR